jgi:7-keto-8-aminopelargonate synthetase-like enzyme
VLAAARHGLARDGLNVAASRLTTGNHRLYSDLERQIAGFFSAEDALLVSTGYLTDVIVGQALAGTFSHAIIDEQAHLALQDAARFLDCPVLQFAHANAEALADTIRRCGPGARLILLTDGMFSRDGSVAPLKAYLKVLPRDAWLLVDDAHGAGVMGAMGKGTLEHAGIGRRHVIQTITLSKAFGGYGGAILGPRSLRRLITERSHMFIGSTPAPLPLLHAARRSLQLLRADGRFRQRLRTNSDYVKIKLREAGWDVAQTPGPIVMLMPRSRTARKLNDVLLRAGIYPPFIKYPGGPAGGYFRFVISSEHSRAQLDKLVRVLNQVNGNRTSR